MTARLAFSSSLLAAALVLAACAGAGRPHPTYVQELDELTAQCRDRGGVLRPVPGATTGRVQTDHVCEIRGGASRLNNRPDQVR